MVVVVVGVCGSGGSGDGGGGVRRHTLVVGVVRASTTSISNSIG